MERVGQRNVHRSPGLDLVDDTRGLDRVGTGRPEGHHVVPAGRRTHQIREPSGQTGGPRPNAALGHEGVLLVQPRRRHTHQRRVIVAEKRSSEASDQVEDAGAVGPDQVIALGAGVHHVQVTRAKQPRQPGTIVPGEIVEQFPRHVRFPGDSGRDPSRYRCHGPYAPNSVGLRYFAETQSITSRAV